MISLSWAGGLRIALALSIASAFIVEPVAGNYASAAVSSGSIDAKGDQLRDQLNDIINTSFDFCDPATEHAHMMALTTASINLAQHQLGNHHPDPEDVKLAEDKAVQDAKADGAPEDLPYVTDYEDAGRRGDAEAQSALFKKMTPAAQAQAAQFDRNYTLVINLLTPLAEAGDVKAELDLAGLYSISATGSSAKYQEPISPKLAAMMRKVFPHWAPVDPPENLPLAFKYFQSAAATGDVWGQWGLARAYACGWGTQKNLILAYMWFSLGLAQRGVTVETTGASLPPNGHQKDYALDRDFIITQMKPEEIKQAKQLQIQCYKSGYKNCD